MNPPVYIEYMRALRHAMEGDGTGPQDFDKNLVLDISPSTQAMFTIKNYNRETGVSTKVHLEDQAGQEFDVKGPMGKGLMPSKDGLHVAFAAGTGALCFVDLVAYLIRKTLKLDSVPDKMAKEIKVEEGNPELLDSNEHKNTSIQDSGDTMSMIVSSGNTSLKMYVSFVSREDAVALELFEAFD